MSPDDRPPVDYPVATDAAASRQADDGPAPDDARGGGPAHPGPASRDQAGGGSPGGRVAAWVADQPLSGAEVAAEVARLRAGAGALAALLPADGTADGRQLRRWVTQRVVIRRLLEREHAARGLRSEAGAGEGPLGNDHTARAAFDEAPRASVPASPDTARRPRSPAGSAAVRPDPALLGAAAADVLATSAAARAVYDAVTAGVAVSEPDVRAYYERNPDRYTRPERWLVRQAFHAEDPATLDTALGAAQPTAPTALIPAVAEAIRDALAAGRRRAGPLRTELGWHLVAVDRVLPGGPIPYDEVRAEIAAYLLDRRGQQAFARWLDERYAALVRLARGYEHPADPRQPDATHRH
jgi:[acyl-carrier-protein] S-malonyltransferase